MNITTLPSIIVTDPSTLEQISRWIYAIVYPMILVSGLIGNIFSTIIFSLTKLNASSCGIYFLLLSIFDSLALIGGLHHCLTIGYQLNVANASYCRFRNFLLYTSMDLTSWMIVAVSIDRCLKVRYPIAARSYLTRKLAMFISASLTVIFILKNVHFLTVLIGNFTVNAAEQCDPNPAYRKYVFFFKTIWPWIDLTTYALIPFLVVTFCNCCIIRYQYERHLKFRRTQFDRSMMNLLLISSISLIIGNLPITTLAIIYPYISSSYDTNEIYDATAFLFDLFRLPSYGSLAWNFYLYYYHSNIFRQQTIVLYRRYFG